MRTILIGIDDTDNDTSPGTGRLARSLCEELTKGGMESLGVTRHQFLLDKAIPYTSHNSGACIAVESNNGIEQADFAFDFVACASAKGSDPGVCVAFSDDVPRQASEFGWAAKEKILKIEESFQLAEIYGIKLRGLGGDCLGVIGALASVGLRAQGNDGRFIDLPGLRDLPRKVNIETYQDMGIAVQHQIDSRQPNPSDTYDTQDWVRPRLINGKAVLIVKWSEKDSAWVPIDNKKNQHSQHSEK